MTCFFPVKDVEVFEAEHLPDFAKTYILPRKMERKSTYKEEEDVYRKQSLVPSKKHSVADLDSRNQSIANADFQFSMLKASLDYDTELFGAPSASMQGVDVAPEEDLSQEVESLWPESLVQERKMAKSLVPCNAPGGMLDFAKYVQDGGYVPEAVRNAQVGLELEVFASNPGDDIKNRMQSFTEMNFYDGTLNLNISLQQAHTNMAAMLAEVRRKHLDKIESGENQKIRSRRKLIKPVACVTLTLLLGHFPTFVTVLVIFSSKFGIKPILHKQLFHGVGNLCFENNF